jgi:phosphoglycerate dehydrogenase-like enzyme
MSATIKQHKVLFLTRRSPRHQQNALAAAPPELAVVMLRHPPRDLIVRELADAEFLISERSDEIDASLIAAAPKLRLIQRLGSLSYDIDMAAAQRAGVAVCTWPVRSCILVAEHMVMQMLALLKKLPEVKAIAEAAADWGHPSLRTDENTFAYNWSGRTGVDGIEGATVGILGFGEIGTELARRLRPFDPAQVLYNKRRRLPSDVEQELGLRYVSQEQLLAESDLLCSLLPYFAETDHLLNADAFAQMKPGALIVHCGSGSVIDEEALAEALRRGQLAGAAMDTFEWEPIRPGNPLLPLARDPAMNVLLTPHTAAGTPSPLRRNQERGRASDYANILHMLRGKPLLHRVV